MIVSTSPSGSESLSSTGSTADRPGRTPYVSSSATGSRFSSVRSGGWTSASWFSSTSSDSCPSPFGGVRSSQLLTSCMSSDASHDDPPDASFSTTWLPSVRKTRPSLEAPSIVCTMSRDASAQSRTICWDPCHAPYAHSPATTGSSGVPAAPPFAVSVASDPSSGTSTSDVDVATRTTSPRGASAARRASSADPIDVARPSGVATMPSALSSTTGTDPTEVISALDPETPSSVCSTGSPATDPSAPISMVVSTCSPGSNVCTVPSRPTVITASAPSSTAGSASAGSNEPISSMPDRYRLPSFGTRIATVSAPRCTRAPAGSCTRSPSTMSAPSMRASVLSPLSKITAPSRSCITSMRSLETPRSWPSSSAEEVLR